LENNVDTGVFRFDLIDNARIYNAVSNAEEIAALAQQATLKRNQTPNIVRGLVVSETVSPFLFGIVHSKHSLISCFPRVFTSFCVLE